MVEVKSAGDDAWLTAAGDQVSRYWNRYRLVLVTNTRDFVLVGEDAAGRPAKLETFRLAEDAEDFRRRLEHPHTFAQEIGAGLGEYLSRALSHRARADRAEGSRLATRFLCPRRASACRSDKQHTIAHGSPLRA